MALGGDLRNINLADIFQTLSMNRQVGTLVVRNGVKEKRVYFSGTGVSLCSGRTIPGFRLGRYLVGTRTITEEDLQIALEEQRRTGDLIGKALVDLELCSPDDIETVIRYHAAEELYEIFGWDRGEFQFLEGSSSDILDRPSPFALTQFEAGSIVMEAARRIDEWERVRESIPSDTEIFVHTGVEGLALDPEEWGADLAGVYVLVDGKRDVGEILNEYHLSLFDTGMILRELVLNGLIRVCDFAELTAAAWALIDKHEIEAASRVLERAHGQEPGDIEVLQHLTDCYEKLDEKRAAASALLKIGMLRLEEDETESAIHALEKAEKYDPGNDEAPILLIRAYRKEANREAVADKARSAASIASEKENFDQAIELCREGLQAVPGNVALRTVMANAHLGKGHKDLALEELEGIAETLEAAQNIRKLEEIYKKILILDSSRKEYLKRLQDLKVGAVNRKKRLVKLGVMGGGAIFLLVFSLLLLSTGTAADERITEAQRLFAEGKYDEAYDLAIKIASDDPGSDEGAIAKNLLAQIDLKRSTRVSPESLLETELIKCLEDRFAPAHTLIDQKQEYRKGFDSLRELTKYMASEEYAEKEKNAGEKAAQKIRNHYRKSVKVLMQTYASTLDRLVLELKNEDARLRAVKPSHKIENIRKACREMEVLLKASKPEEQTAIIGAAEIIEGHLRIANDRVSTRLAGYAAELKKIHKEGSARYHVLRAVVRRHELIDDFRETNMKVGDLMNEGELSKARELCRAFLGRCTALRSEAPLQAYAATVEEILGDDRLNLDGQIQAEMKLLDEVLEGIRTAEGLIVKGEYEEANRLFRRIIRKNFKIDFSSLISLVLHLRTKPDGAEVTMTPQGEETKLLGSVPPEGLMLRYPPYGQTTIVIRKATFEKVEIVIKDFQDEHAATPVVSLAKVPTWHSTVGGAMEATPTFHRGKVIATSRDGHLRLLKPASGEVLADHDTKILNGFSASALVTGGTIVVPALDETLLALDLVTRKTAWSLKLEGRLRRNPILVGDTIVVANEEGTVFGIRDGAEVWRKDLGARVQGELAVFDKTFLVATTGGHLHRLDPGDGEEIYRVQIADRISATPIVDVAGRAYLGTDSTELVAVRAENGKVLWRFKADNAVRGRAALLGDRVFFATLSGTIYQVNVETGKEVHKIHLPENTPVETGATAGGSKVYVVDTSGVLRAICPGRGELWTYKLSGRVSAPPLFCDGALYITTESGGVYCFQE